MTCLGCQKIELGAKIKLKSGKVACNTCPDYLLQCEAREWKKRAREKGRAWWAGQKEAIRKKRGQAGLDRLLNEMNKK